MSPRTQRSLITGGAVIRLAYALGLLLAPEAMATRRLAARTPGNGYATMTTRGFGAVQTNVSLLTLRSAALNTDERLVLGLNLTCDLGDVIATLLEWRRGELPALAAIGSTLLNGTGVAIWSTLLHGASRT